MELNQRQTAAVTHQGNAVLVACPGSGKTRVLIERIVRIATAAPDDRFIVVTFTRQAAAELRQRLEGRVANLQQVKVATFHALSLHQLILSDTKRICGPSQQVALLRQASRAFIPHEEFRVFQEAVDQHTSGHSDALDDPEHQAAYDAYLDLLDKNKVVDFSQGILSVVQGMDDGSIRPLPTEHLLVDEVQDIDPVQLRWILHHAAQTTSLTAVGDDDQSIYSFRNSLGHKGMLTLQKKLNAQLLFLNTNYRSHSEVLGLSSKLISHNTHRIPKDLYSDVGPGGTVNLHTHFVSVIDETMGVVDRIQESPDTQWAIIARTNAKLDPIQNELRVRRIPHSRPGKEGFWESEDPAFFLDLLDGTLISDPFFKASISTRLDIPTDALEDSSGFATYQDALRSSPSNMPPESRIHAISDWLKSNLQGIPKYRIDSIITVTELCDKSLCSMTGSLSQRLSQARRPNTQSDTSVLLLTMHAAKGREFPNVWIIGLEDTVIPNRKSDVEEERRLLYVAMTRAERALHLSYSWNKVINRADETTRLQKTIPTRFLSADLQIPFPERPRTDSTKS